MLLFSRWHQKPMSSSVEPRLVDNLSTVDKLSNSSVRFYPRKTRRIRRSVDTRQKEKQILDSVLGPKVYDRRIRPIGRPDPDMFNETGKGVVHK